MSVWSEQCFVTNRFWILVSTVLAFGIGARVADAATLWVQPAEGMSKHEVGSWAATENGSATFTFALPDDLEDIVSAKIVLLPSADDWVTSRSQLSLSQEGLGRDYYTDEVQVADPVELLANRVTEVDITALVPHRDMLTPGEDYLTVRLAVKGLGDGEISSAAQVLGLRLEYQVAEVDAEGQAAQENGSDNLSSTSRIASYAILPDKADSSSPGDSAAEAAKTQVQNGQSDARLTNAVVGTELAGADPKATDASVKFSLNCSGLARFGGLGGGRFEFATPGGWPGIIGYSPNGFRREIQLTNNHMWILANDSSAPPDASHGITIVNNGNVGIGTYAPSSKLTVAGRTKTNVLEITGGSDLSERFKIGGSQDGVALAPGMVVSIDPDAPGALVVSQESYDRKVAGIISGAGDVKPGMLMGQEGTLANGQNPVALTGRVYCLADATKGGIQPGDLLTSSDTPGHAMKVSDYDRAQGAILGKAMTSLPESKGLVLVLVTLQ